MAVVYLGCVLAIALLAAGGVGCAGRDDREHYENASGNDGVAHNAGPSFAAKLARVMQYDFGLTSVQADNPRHADALPSQCDLGRAELRPIGSEDHRGEGCIRVRLTEVKGSLGTAVTLAPVSLRISSAVCSSVQTENLFYPYQGGHDSSQ